MFGLGGLGGMNPAKLKGMMKQLGINQEEINAERVVIETQDSKIVIDNPNVQKIKMQGQESWQITGDAREEAKAGISEEDIKLVMEKTGKSRKEVQKVLEKTKDIAEAIVELGE